MTPHGQHDLRAIYRDYLACLNERRWDGLGEYVADELIYNGRDFTVADYRAMLVADTEAIPDLQFRAELLVADDDVVACRLYFTCHPTTTFLGFEPAGGQVSFAEHVFYRFDERRIVEVWSVIDKEAVRDQISAQSEQ